MYQFNIYDYFVLSFVLVVSVSIGLYQAYKERVLKYIKLRRKDQDTGCYEGDTVIDENENTNAKLREYLIGSGTMNTLPIACSLLASSFSATAFLGFPAEAYQFGIQFWVGILGIATTPLIGAFLTGPLFSRLNLSSVFEYLKLRYDSNVVRLLAVTCYVIRNMVSLAIFIYGPSLTIGALTRISTPMAIFLIGSIATFYTTIGGIKAVIYTDVFQMVIMLVGILAVIIKGTYDLNGFANVWEINKRGGRLNFFDFDPNPFIRQSFWSLYIGMVVLFGKQYALDQQMLQRFQAAKNKRSAQIALLLNIPAILFFLGLCLCSGLIIYATYENCDPLLASQITRIKNPNQLITYFVTDKLKVINGFVGLFLAAVLCGSLSSISSFLNSLASIVLEDYLKRFRYFKNLNDSKTTLTAKLIVVVCGVGCTVLAFFASNLGGNLVQISTSLNGAINAPVSGIFILAAFFPFSNEIGAIVGFIMGFGVASLFTFGTYMKEPIYPKLITTAECYMNTSASFTSSYYSNSSILLSKEAMNLHGFDKIFSLSYLWFSPIGALTTVVFGIIFSLLTGCNKKTISSDLILIKYCVRFQRKWPAKENILLTEVKK